MDMEMQAKGKDGKWHPWEELTDEAARVLGITPGRMRQIADKFPHIKKGDTKQGQLLFVRKSLIKNV